MTSKYDQENEWICQWLMCGVTWIRELAPTLCIPTRLSQLSPPEDPELLGSFTHMGDEVVTSNITEYSLGQSHPVFTQQPVWVTAGLRTQERNLESCSPHPHQSSLTNQQSQRFPLPPGHSQRGVEEQPSCLVLQGLLTAPTTLPANLASPKMEECPAREKL